MTTAHRPTFDPAQGKEALRGPAYHQRLLPAYTHLKTRKPGQGGEADGPRDLRAELLAAEAAHFAKKAGIDTGSKANDEALPSLEATAPKRQLIEGKGKSEDREEDPEAKRRRVLEESRELDAESEDSEDESSEDESDSDEEDETAELMRELEKIKKERAEQREKEEREKAEKEQESREYEIAKGNPLLNPQDFSIKRRWDDDVVFKNQARGTENKRDKEFVNDLLRSDFHKRFMSKWAIPTTSNSVFTKPESTPEAYLDSTSWAMPVPQIEVDLRSIWLWSDGPPHLCGHTVYDAAKLKLEGTAASLITVKPHEITMKTLLSYLLDTHSHLDRPDARRPLMEPSFCMYIYLATVAASSGAIARLWITGDIHHRTLDARRLLMLNTWTLILL
ncbi:complexed with cef1p [Ascosphaera pollenicola]|nr:complexed with cef1p [Ascosphaera pollenicola]